MNGLRLSRRQLIAGAAAGATLVAAGPLQAADNFPAKPVHIMYPFPAGGGMEVVLRVMVAEMQKSLGQSVLIENRAGGTGAIALQAALSAPADGYTIFVGPVGTMAILPQVRKLPFNAIKDAVPIARLAEFKGVMVVGAHVPVNSVPEFIAYAKANPGKLTQGISGIAAQGHLSAEILQKEWGLKVTIVPYKGAAEMTGDLLGGRLDIVNDLTMLPYVKSGKAKLLTVFDTQRLPDFPDVPALPEIRGVPLVNMTGTWFAAFAPSGTPTATIDRLAMEFEKVLKNPEVLAKMKAVAINPAYAGPRELRKVWEEDYASYGAVIRETGIKAE
jgi:tripartite-type tricarboxylate transporter receptor subunit TctC